MAKKIYDIKPPKMAHKKTVEKVVVHKKVKTVKEKPLKSSRPVEDPLVIVKDDKYPVRQEKKKKSSKFNLIIFILIVLLVVGIYLFFTLPKADITIWPKVDALSFQQTISADKTVNAVDATKAIIPAQYFQSIKTVAQDFPATGNGSNEGKATGTITIFNKYDPPKSFTFVAGTHFMSDSGKLFVSSQKVVIPSAKKTGSKITPGSVSIEVQAVEGGTDYNISPSNFSVPGLKGTAAYYSIYATSKSAMAGGYTGKVKKVTDDDLQGAKDVLTEKATTDSVADVKKQIPAEYVLLDNAILSNSTDSSSKTKAGAIADSFNYSVTVQTSVLVFKKSDIDEFVKNYVTTQLPSGKTLLENSLKTDYSASLVDISGGKATLNLNISAGVYQDIDRNSIALTLLNQNSNQIKQTINNNLGDKVSKIDVKLWPFWVTAAPNSQKAVNVFLKFQ